MIDTAFLSQLDRFSLVVRKRVTSSFTGQRKSLSIGKGISFQDHRIYAPGDDFRRIDWKVYARTDDLYIKNYEEEKNLTVHIILDYSASMDFGKPIKKFDYACMLGVGFAYLAMKDNERFQFSTFSDELNVFKSSRGKSQLVIMIDHLNNLKIKGKSNLKDAIYQYKRFIDSKSVIIIISDFLIDIKDIEDSLYFLGDHEIKVIQVLHPVERNLNLVGDFNLKDSETGEKLRTYISPRLKQYYQKLLEEHIAKIEEICNKLKINFYSLTTDTPIFDAFYSILS